MPATKTLKVRDVMTRDLVSLPQSATAMEAAKAMRDSNIGSVVVKNGEDLVGIVTDRDLVIRAIAAGKDPSQTRLDQICSRELRCLSPEDGLDVTLKTIGDNAVRRLLVVDGAKPVGIVSLGDLAQRLDKTSVLGQVSAASPNH